MDDLSPAIRALNAGGIDPVEICCLLLCDWQTVEAVLNPPGVPETPVWFGVDLGPRTEAGPPAVTAAQEPPVAPETPAAQPPARPRPSRAGQDAKPKADGVKERLCLKCGDLFKSEGPGNRICTPCKQTKEWRAGLE